MNDLPESLNFSIRETMTSTPHSHIMHNVSYLSFLNVDLKPFIYFNILRPEFIILKIFLKTVIEILHTYVCTIILLSSLLSVIIIL